jgi:IclR family transcriptional regulator, acetate operon repressor
MTPPDIRPSQTPLGSSTERSLRLLTVLAHEGRPLSLAELIEALDLPKATVYRICTQLLECGFITRDINERDYVAGPALRKLALDTLNHGTVHGLRHKILSDLVAKVGETCNFTTLDGADVIYLDRVEAPWPWRLTLEVGVHVPLHCTASGKLFLATMEPKRRDMLIATLSLERMTDHTIYNADDLHAECEVIAKRGYAFDREEFITGLMAIAVPVRDSEGKVRAAMAIHAPTARLSDADLNKKLPALQAAAKRMGALL